MASPKLTFFAVFLFTSSCVFVGFGQQNGGVDPGSLPCVQQLIPCQPYLKPTTPSTPPATCCIPLKDIVAHQTQCLCEVFNDADLLKTFNVTKQDGLNLAKACGANADADLCNNASPPGASSPASSDSNSKAGAPSPHKAAANMISSNGRFLYLAQVLLLLIATVF